MRLMSYLCPGKLPIGYSMSRTGIKPSAIPSNTLTTVLVTGRDGAEAFWRRHSRREDLLGSIGCFDTVYTNTVSRNREFPRILHDGLLRTYFFARRKCCYLKHEKVACD